VTRIACSTDGCDHVAEWHVRVTCDRAPRLDEVALCSYCLRGVGDASSRWSCVAHGDRILVQGVHQLATPECAHPDATWHDRGCVIPTTGLTVRYSKEAAA